MGLAGAIAGAASGFVVAWSSYATLALLAALITVPLIALALRPGQRLVTAEGRLTAVRLTDFWERLDAAFGPGYAMSVATDQVLPQLVAAP
jgi:hypothetical protein